MQLSKNKMLLIFAAGGALLLAGLAVLLIILTGKQPSAPVTAENTSSQTESVSPNIAGVPSSESSGASTESNDTPTKVVLDVTGDPGEPDSEKNNVAGNPGMENTTARPGADGQTDSSHTGGTVTESPQRPTASNTVTPDGEEPKPNPQPPVASDSNYPSTPDEWQPLPPGQGTGEQIGSGFESIPIDMGADKLQGEVGLLAGSYLLERYNTIYPDAETPRAMVEAAVKQYAATGQVILEPSQYGLPKLVGEYHARIKATGSNAAEAARYVADYMIGDQTFNSKIATEFSSYKDGYLAVYQKDGYFYILFAVIDKGYDV